MVGGVAGLAIILALLWFFCIKRRRNNEEAFDEKTFDPSRVARHSVNDPMDLLSPSVAAAGGAAASGNSAPRVDPFPFQNPSSPEDLPYDPYSHAPMRMPDARDYMDGAYDPYGGMEGGYGVAAAAGAAGAGIGARSAADHYNHGESAYSSSDYPSSSMSPTQSSSAALAKQREAAAERRTSRTSSGYNMPTGSGNGPQEVIGSPAASESGGRRESGISEGRTSVYQHTDMGSMPDEEEEQLDEVPPNYQ